MERVGCPGDVVHGVVGSGRPDNMADRWRVSTAVLGERYRVDTPEKVAGNGKRPPVEPTAATVVEEVVNSQRPWTMEENQRMESAVRRERYGMDGQ